jgi:hypothetical protein
VGEAKTHLASVGELGARLAFAHLSEGSLLKALGEWSRKIMVLANERCPTSHVLLRRGELGCRSVKAYAAEIDAPGFPDRVRDQ